MRRHQPRRLLHRCHATGNLEQCASSCSDWGGCACPNAGLCYGGYGHGDTPPGCLDKCRVRPIFVAASVYLAVAYNQECMADTLWYLAFAGAAGVCIYIFAVVPISEWRRGTGGRWCFTIVVLSVRDEFFGAASMTR